MDNNNKKKIIIFITVFIAVGAILLVLYFLLNKNNPTTNTDQTTSSWYQKFNPFSSTGNSTTNNNQSQNTNSTSNTQIVNNSTSKISKFFQITDFAVAGATFLQDSRPVSKTEPVAIKREPVSVVITPDTEEGRKGIQTFLNNALSLKPPLKVDGKFGKMVTTAIKSFQKLNKLPVTGIIDAKTAPLFTITTIKEVNNVPLVPSVRYVERMNGHIYRMFLDTKDKEEISNSTIPGIYEAFFSNDGSTVVYRYLSDDGSINSFIATQGSPKGEFLPLNITDFSLSYDKIKYFYLTKNDNGVTGNIGYFGGDKKEVVFNYPFTEWLSAWDRSNNIYLTTKASYGADGTVFSLDATKKTISKVFGGVAGLTTQISPSGLYVLYGVSTMDGKLNLGIFNVNRRETKDLANTLPEKCIWSNDGINIYCAIPNVIIGNQYPDTWYQGLVSFDDYFAKINTQTGEKTMIANSVGETPIDGTKLFLNDKEDTLFFINKKDSTLWGLHLQ